MKVEIVFPGPQWIDLREHLFGSITPTSSFDCDEQMALLLAGPSVTAEITKLVVREVLAADVGDLVHQSAGRVAPTGEFVAAALTRCRQEGWSLIEVHSHPFSKGRSTTFSGIDWNNDRTKMPALVGLLPETAIHATMVIGQTSLDAHYYNRATATIDPVHQVRINGVQSDASLLTRLVPRLPEETGDHDRPFPVTDRHLRQVALLGSQTQAVLAQSTVVIVGLGGLGCFAALECAHLGVGTLVLIDPDAVELTNLNRLLGAREQDVGRPKVEVYGRLVEAISPGINVVAIPASILSDDALSAAKQADVLLGCVDSHGARLVMNHIAVQYAVPFVDAGSGARLEGDEVTHVGGQVQLVLPGLGCLECRGFIDLKQAAFDLAPPHVRQRELDHGYGTSEPAPSVVFLNGVVASLQVAETVKLLAGTSGITGKGPSAITLYDLLRPSLTRIDAEPVLDCLSCGSDGVTALADLSPLAAAVAPQAMPPAVVGAVAVDA